MSIIWQCVILSRDSGALHSQYLLDMRCPCFTDVGSGPECGPFHICRATADGIIKRGHVLDRGRVKLPALHH